MLHGRHPHAWAKSTPDTQWMPYSSAHGHTGRGGPARALRLLVETMGFIGSIARARPLQLQAVGSRRGAPPCPSLERELRQNSCIVPLVQVIGITVSTQYSSTGQDITVGSGEYSISTTDSVVVGRVR